MRKFVIPEIFFKELSKKDNKLYVRIWIYWLSEFADEIFEPDFLEKQAKAYPDVREIKEIHQFGVQLLFNEFKIQLGKKAKKLSTREEIVLAQQIIEYLNSKTGSTFTVKPNCELISERLREGYSITDFKTVIDNQVKQWLGTDMQKYLRPLTLFQKKKFENYLNTNVSNEQQSIRKEQSDSKTRFEKLADSADKAKALVRLRKEPRGI